MEYADLNQPSYNNVDYNLLLEDAINWTTYVSSGKLNASGQFNVINYILNAIIWCHRELLLLVEDLPTAGVLEFLSKVAGVQRSLGSKATTTVEFTLVNTQNNPFIIEKGYQISTPDGTLIYYTVDNLIIPSGSLNGTVIAEAEDPGELYNVAAYEINRVFLEYANLNSVQNIEPAQGGTDPETEEQAVERGAREIRRREILVSKDDVEDFVAETIGNGSSTKVIEWYETEGSNRPGEIEAYVLDAEGNPINNSIRQTLNSAIQQRLPLGTFVSVYPMKVLYIDAILNIVVEDFANSNQVADELYELFKVELSSRKIKAGEDVNINRLIKTFQQDPAISKLVLLTLNGAAVDVLMPNQYTVAYPGIFTVNITTQNGNYIDPYIYGDSPDVSVE